MAQGQLLNGYTNSKYAFHFLCPMLLWRRLLTTKGGFVTHTGQIIAMLKASHLPKAVGIIHCQSHQTDSSIMSRGDNRADEAARAAALQGPESPHLLQRVHTQQPISSQSPSHTRQILSCTQQFFHPNSQGCPILSVRQLKPTQGTCID